MSAFNYEIVDLEYILNTQKYMKDGCHYDKADQNVFWQQLSFFFHYYLRLFI